MATWEDAQRIADDFPDTDGSTAYRNPPIKLRGIEDSYDLLSG